MVKAKSTRTTPGCRLTLDLLDDDSPIHAIVAELDLKSDTIEKVNRRSIDEVIIGLSFYLAVFLVLIVIAIL